MQSTNLGNQRTQQQMATDAAIAPWALRQAKASALAAEVGLQDKLKPKIDPATAGRLANLKRSDEHTSELQSLMRISYAVFCLKKKTTNTTTLILSHKINTEHTFS